MLRHPLPEVRAQRTSYSLLPICSGVRLLYKLQYCRCRCRCSRPPVFPCTRHGCPEPCILNPAHRYPHAAWLINSTRIVSIELLRGHRSSQGLSIPARGHWQPVKSAVAKNPSVIMQSRSVGRVGTLGSSACSEIPSRITQRECPPYASP